jgi:flavorubredoxin
MEQIKIFDNLYMFNTYNQYINLSFNQFLLLGEEPVLIHTGSYDMTEELIPKLKELLGYKELSYIFISHFESDECGGLSLLLKHFPNTKSICSAVTARQLQGFGLLNDPMIKAPGDTLDLKSSNLKFIAYPSEMHLWEGLLAFETEAKLLFSSDLFISMGKLSESVVNSTLPVELGKIAPHQIPDPAALKSVKGSLMELPVKYIVPGHGPVLKL